MGDESPNQNDSNVVSMLHGAARAYAANGVAIFPCRPRDKRPLTSNGFHDATCDIDQIDAWWTANPDANIGVALGANNVFALDVDGPDGRAVLDDLQASYQPLPDTFQVVTGREEGEGRHYLYRQPDGEPIRNRHLGDHLETRGAGGYVIAAPSVHPSGAHYTAEGKWEDIVDAPDWLIALARKPAADPQPIPAAAPTGDEIARRRVEGLTGRLAMMTADSGQNCNDNLNHAAYVAGQLIGANRIDREWAIERLFTAAIRAGLTPTESSATIASGIDAGIGNPDHHTPAASSTVPPITPLVIPDDTEQPTSTDRANTSWAPVDGTTYIDGTWTPPQPTQLTRTDGTALFYPGRINLLFGESEAGKGWVALHAVAQALAGGHNVLYIDFEDYPDTIYARLLRLGATPGQLTSQFAYIRPDAALDDPGRHALGATVTDMRPALVILDGVTGAMSLHALDTNSSTDVDQFYSMLGEPLARIDAAVVFIDHVTKSAENRGKGPIGSQHKRARVSGASYEVTAVQAIAPGRAGKLRLKIDKDRLGAVRSVHPSQAGEFVLNSTDPNRSVAQIVAPASDGQDFRPTHAMEHVSRGLEDAGDEGLSKRGIEELGGAKKETLDLAVQRLIEEGFVTREPGARGALIHKSLRPFRTVPEVTTVPDDRPASPTVPNGSGTVLGGKSAPTVPGPPALHSGGRGTVDEPARPADSKQVPL